MDSGTAVDAGNLARQLRAHVRGEVRIDAGARALYATDASNCRQLPVEQQNPPHAVRLAGRHAKDDS